MQHFFSTTSFIIVVLILGTHIAVAGEWEFVPRVNVSESYTDNVTLTGNNEIGDLITTLTPGVSVRGKSPRLDMNVDYNLNKLLYMDNSEFNDVSQQLQSSSELMVIEDLVFFETRATLSQQNTNNNNTFVESDRSQTGNRSDVLFYMFRPVLRHAFGSWAALEASYGMSTNERSQAGANADNTSGSSSDEDTIDVRLETGPRVARLPFGVTYSSRDQQRSNGRSNKLESISADLGYRINHQLLLNAEGGSENNDYASASQNRDGLFWYIGGVWTPNPRTEVSGRFGDRFFGKTFNVDVSHRRRRMVYRISYEEEVRTSNQVQSNVQLLGLEDPFGNPIFNPTDFIGSGSPLDTPSIRDDVIISTDLRFSVDYSGRRTDFSIRFSEHKNEFQESSTTEKIRLLSVDVDRRLTRLLKAGVAVLWRENTSRDSGNDSNVLRISPFLNLQLSSHLSLDVTYDYIDGGGSMMNNQFVENALTAGLSYAF